MFQAIFEVKFHNGMSKLLGMRTAHNVDGYRWAEKLQADMQPSVKEVSFLFLAAGMVWDCTSDESAISMMEVF